MAKIFDLYNSIPYILFDDALILKTNAIYNLVSSSGFSVISFVLTSNYKVSIIDIGFFCCSV